MYLKNSHSSRDLPEPAFADHRHQARLAILGARLEGLDQRLQLALAPDERRLEPGAAPGAAGAGDDPQRGPGADRLLAALDLVLAGVLVGDRRLRSPAG